MSQYILLIKNYILYFNEKLKIKIYNNFYLKYLFFKGINMLNNIFKVTYCYNENLEFIINNCQKGYLLYIEFIEQINDIKISYLKLNSKDALLFCYKKTLFDLKKTNNIISNTKKIIQENKNNIINNINFNEKEENFENYENNENNENNENLLNHYINIYFNLLILYYFDYILILNNNNINNLNIINNLFFNIIKFNLNIDKIDKLNNFIIYLDIYKNEYNLNIINYPNLILHFIKNIINNKNIDYEKIINKYI